MIMETKWELVKMKYLHEQVQETTKATTRLKISQRFTFMQAM